MHVPVLLNEIIDGLNLSAGVNCLDGTLGAGGHAKAILEQTGSANHGGSGGKVIGFDRDAAALEVAANNLSQFGDRFIPVHDSYANITEHNEQITAAGPLGGILLDLGLSSMQLDDETRGFAFRFPEAKLDMRFDQTGSQATAADLLNSATETELVRIFSEYGEFRKSKTLAAEIVKVRSSKSLVTVGDLLQIIDQVIKQRYGKVNPATTVFQALRIAVNQELQQLHDFLPKAVQILDTGGRLVVISFHSLEDRIVKQFLKLAATECICPPELPECRCEHEASMKIITKKPITATDEEIKINPRARSAKLRIASKL